ncbi:MAG: iron dependent repressor, metal binding and dimerization domain protein, partial [Candidatus Hecatellaceae archaeon]
RHEVFRRFLEEILGVDGKTAEEDACMLEHAVSRQTLKKLVKFVEEQMKIRKISPG